MIQTGHAKYLFVFEGALGSTEILSVNVLACLWPLEPPTESLHRIVRAWWPSSYDYIVTSLGITAEIAKHSYVVDAVRIGILGSTKPDLQHNRELLKREIELLTPELIVLVGRTAERTIGNEARTAESSRYLPVPFPTRTRSEDDKKKAEEEYGKLKRKYEELQDK